FTCFTISLSVLTARPAISTLLPYTTLFRSAIGRRAGRDEIGLVVRARLRFALVGEGDRAAAGVAYGDVQPAELLHDLCDCRLGRSEEHTSELQSRENLVCRLLLEKKKQHRH